MNLYEIKFCGKTYRYRGETGSEALDRFANRKVFGKPLIIGYRINSYDAESHGGRWIFASSTPDEFQIEVDRIG